MNIAVIVATYGSAEWDRRGDALADTLSVSTAAEKHDGTWQTQRIVRVHAADGTLAQVRNAGARGAVNMHGDNTWLCFVDADDDLGRGYLAAMRAAYDAWYGAWLDNGEQRGSRRYHDPTPAPLLIPRVQYTRGRRVFAPKYPSFRPGADETSLQDGNWLVIGTLVHAPLFFEVGGFEEWEMYEDWALFARCWKRGAQLVQVPDAIYIAHRQPRSRNVAGENKKRETHRAIKRAVFPELFDEEEVAT